VDTYYKVNQWKESTRSMSQAEWDSKVGPCDKNNKGRSIRKRPSEKRMTIHRWGQSIDRNVGMIRDRHVVGCQMTRVTLWERWS
jgi:hypothetical protein